MFFFSFRKFDLKSFNVVMWFLGGSFRRGWSQFPSAAGTTTSSSRRTPTWTVLSADTRSRTSSCSRVSPRTSWPIYGRHCVSLSHMTVSGREQLSNDCKIAHHHWRFCVCFKRATLKQNWNLPIWYVLTEISDALIYFRCRRWRYILGFASANTDVIDSSPAGLWQTHGRWGSWRGSSSPWRCISSSRKSARASTLLRRCLLTWSLRQREGPPYRWVPAGPPTRQNIVVWYQCLPEVIQRSPTQWMIWF